MGVGMGQGQRLGAPQVTRGTPGCQRPRPVGVWCSPVPMELRDDRGQHGIVLWSHLPGLGCCGDLVAQHWGAERPQEEQVPPTGTFTEHPYWGWRARMWPLPPGPHCNPPVDICTPFFSCPGPGLAQPCCCQRTGAMPGVGGSSGRGVGEVGGDSVGARCCRMERDKAFVRRKAEWATVRMHLRDKYHLAQVRTSPPVVGPRGSSPSSSSPQNSPRPGGCQASPRRGEDS